MSEPCLPGLFSIDATMSPAELISSIRARLSIDGKRSKLSLNEAVGWINASSFSEQF